MTGSTARAAALVNTRRSSCGSSMSSTATRRAQRPHLVRLRGPLDAGGAGPRAGHGLAARHDRAAHPAAGRRPDGQPVQVIDPETAAELGLEDLSAAGGDPAAERCAERAFATARRCGRSSWPADQPLRRQPGPAGRRRSRAAGRGPPHRVRRRVAGRVRERAGHAVPAGGRGAARGPAGPAGAVPGLRAATARAAARPGAGRPGGVLAGRAGRLRDVAVPRRPAPAAAGQPRRARSRRRRPGPRSCWPTCGSWAARWPTHCWPPCWCCSRATPARPTWWSAR